MSSCATLYLLRVLDFEMTVEDNLDMDRRLVGNSRWIVVQSKTCDTMRSRDRTGAVVAKLDTG